MEVIASMDYLFLAIDYREPLWLMIALVLGFAAKMISLPPLVGFLLASFESVADEISLRRPML